MSYTYTDRDLSWLDFNSRVLDQIDRYIPLAEKIMFAGIAADNLDEFMMSRYPRRLSYETQDIKPQIILNHNTIQDRFELLNQKEILFLDKSQIASKETKKEMLEYFDKKLHPIIYPKVITNKIMSPKSKEINIFVELFDEKKNEYSHSNISIPMNVPRLIYLKSVESYMPIEECVVLGFDKIFRGLKVINHCIYMVTRSVNMIYNDFNMDLQSMIAKSIQSMNESWITSVQCSEPFTKRSIGKKLKDYLEITDDTILLDSKYVGLYSMKTLDDSSLTDINRIRRTERTNPFPVNMSIFDIINENDRLVFHPFESFDTTVSKFIMDAAEDPDVASIKMTLYRIPPKSKIITALLKATEMNKIVVVMVELKARFNEKDNLSISRILKEAGVDIIYSDEILKTHAKMCIVTRNEKDKTRIYSHVSTGNYNENNSKIYTDYSFFTSSMAIGKDLNNFFNMLCNPNIGGFKSKEIIYAPEHMRGELKDLIKEQVKNVKNKKKGKIVIKCNSITDIEIAEELYKASKAGVEIKLIVRGACIINPGVNGMSENIEVISIVGKYLEHSRVYSFGTGKEKKVFIGSSDLMYRNLNRRYELLIRIRDDDMVERISNHIKLYMTDNSNSYNLINSKYTKVPNSKKGKTINCHLEFEKEARKRSV